MSPCAPHAPTAAHLRCSKPEMAGADEGDCVIIKQSYNRGYNKYDYSESMQCRSGYACKSLLLNLERKLEAPTGCFQAACLQRLIRPMATRRSWNIFLRIKCSASNCDAPTIDSVVFPSVVSIEPVPVGLGVKSDLRLQRNHRAIVQPPRRLA
jgi:hypothetical protein